MKNGVERRRSRRAIARRLRQAKAYPLLIEHEWIQNKIRNQDESRPRLRVETDNVEKY